MSVYFYFYQDELLYIGSCSESRTELRIYNHGNDFNNNPNKLPFYRDLIANGLTVDDLELEIVKTGLKKRKDYEKVERGCIELYNPACNAVLPGRTDNEYRDANKKRYSILQKNNRERANINNQKYMNSEKGKENQQKYRNENRLKRAEYDKERYEKNKERIK